MLYKVNIQNYNGYIAKYYKKTFLMQAYSDIFEPHFLKLTIDILFD